MAGYLRDTKAYSAVMFARPIPGFDPSPEAYEVSLRPLLAPGMPGR